LDVAGGFETFHAKVALADSELAYVGSANMTVFARHSMELGVLIEGRAARVIANLIRAVTKVARPIPLD
jgi:phosphatidylserine/phosphatidylglycerophosphate/cardiolipin synthase-like enzyme